MADFSKITNGIQTGLNIASSLVSTAQQVKAAKDAQKNGTTVTVNTTPTTTTTTTTDTTTGNSTSTSSTGVSIGINKQTLIVGGLVIVGVVAAIYFMRKNN